MEVRLFATIVNTFPLTQAPSLHSELSENVHNPPRTPCIPYLLQEGNSCRNLKKLAETRIIMAENPNWALH